MSKINTPALLSTGLTEYSVILTESGTKEQARLIELAGTIFDVSSNEEYQLAADVAGEIRKFNSAVEKARKEIKAPILEAGKTADAAAKSAVETTAALVSGIEKLMADYQVEQIRIANAHRERERIEQEEQQRKLNQAQREADDLRKRAEAAQNDFLGTADDLQAELATKEAQVAQIEKSAPVQIAVALPTATGAAVRPTFEYDVTDLAALYRFNPSLVRLEPNLSAIRSYIDAAGADSQIPGLAIRAVTKVTVRASR